MDTSYLTQQVTTIIGQLHALFDEIGVPNHERDSRESELFASLSETLHNHLKHVASEKNQMIEEGKRIITSIGQMEASLDDVRADAIYAPKDEALKITFPLVECLEALREKHKTVSRLHQERYEQIKSLIQALESYSSHLEQSFLQIKLPPVAADGAIPPTFDLSPTYIASVDSEFTRVYEEYNKRVVSVQQLSDEVVKLWAELGTPQAQIDPNIVQHGREAPEQLGLHEADLGRLRARRDKLVEEKRGREKRVKDLKTSIESLWQRLNVEEGDQKAFNARTRGCGLKVINDLEDELSRLNELKKQNLHLFVEDARARLQALWDELYISEEEAIEFTPMFCDVYSDALLSAHEAEIARLEVLKDKRAPTLQLIAKHRSLIKDRDDLAASSQDASRLTLKGQKGERRDPTRLLREEKMRKRIAKDLPKVEQDLIKVLEQWEDEFGRPFYVFGERYLDTLAAGSNKAVPPRSKTPNALPASAKLPTSISTAPRAQAPREPSTLRSKTPVSTVSRNVGAVTRAATDHRSPSRLPARVPLSAMAHGGNSPERSVNQRMQLGKENGIPVRKATALAMAPPPKMRAFTTDIGGGSIMSTPSSILPEDFSRSGSVVRHIPPEDPYNDPTTEDLAHPPRFARAGLVSKTLPSPAPTAIQNHRNMAPPPLPRYYNTQKVFHPEHAQQIEQHADETYSVATSTSPSIASGFSSRHISVTSTATTQSSAISGSENWESYDDGEASEPEPDTSEEYWQKLKSQQQAKVIRGNTRGAVYGNITSGPGMRFGHVADHGQGRPGQLVGSAEDLGVE